MAWAGRPRYPGQVAAGPGADPDPGRSVEQQRGTGLSSTFDSYGRVQVGGSPVTAGAAVTCGNRPRIRVVMTVAAGSP